MMTVCGTLLSFWCQLLFTLIFDSLSPAISHIFAGILSELGYR